ncbi:restriction endonuclease subunit R [Candidatus Micrarchaeota archaeon CG09_land_8_20_14_0_10_60_16]|nr:MAG: restriction endonuclease subunit R [Candidatus Micrarchaeota archaeon CG09_land_8_20_14_0_10_60_16]
MLHQELLEKLGYPKPNPMQAKALAEGFLDAERVVVSAPTASGKTLLALMAIVDNYEKTRTKAVYVVPLRALAAEKQEDFKEKLHPFGITVGLSTGELDSSSEHLHAFDVVVCTSEKMDSLFRHGAPWLKDVGLAVIDEVHLLGDGSRGATLEVVLTKLLHNKARLLCLSGTIPNASEIAAWLKKAKLVESNYRPTPLQLALFDGETLHYSDEDKEKADGVAGLVKRALAENEGTGQALVFVATRRNAEALAKELSATVMKVLNEGERTECKELAERALKALGTPTSQCRALAACLENGIAFHHAGLVEKQRKLIETGFKKDRCLKTIVCTTTLAMGIDYPASWVVVRDLKRFNGAFSEMVSALEVHQMVGRAGRPKYDKKGVGVLCCKPSETRRAAEKYILGDLESIWSQLSNEALLRTHCLGLIASKHCTDRESLYGFFGETLYAKQYGDTEELLEKVEGVVEELEEMGFIREKEKLVATPAGKRASELYIDPLTAHSFIKFVSSEGEKREFDYLLELNKSTEARPLISAGKGEESALWEEAYAAYGEKVNEGDFLDSYKSAKMLNAWVNEATEEEIMESFQLPPGVVHSRARNMEWLCYAMQELAFLLNRTQGYAAAKRLRKRIKNGIKEELLDLCSIRGVGRVRGRRLWNSGVKTQEAYAALEPEQRRAIVYEKSKSI